MKMCQMRLFQAGRICAFGSVFSVDPHRWSWREPRWWINDSVSVKSSGIGRHFPLFISSFHTAKAVWTWLLSESCKIRSTVMNTEGCCLLLLQWGVFVSSGSFLDTGVWFLRLYEEFWEHHLKHVLFFSVCEQINWIRCNNRNTVKGYTARIVTLQTLYNTYRTQSLLGNLWEPIRDNI